jgi:hypothetical protein
MTAEILNAVIARLQASAMECFRLIKDRHRPPLEEGDIDFIAQQGMRLANLEGAIITLQQYAPNIEAYVKEGELAKARALLAAEEEITRPHMPAVFTGAPPESISTEKTTGAVKKRKAAIDRSLGQENE